MKVTQFLIVGILTPSSYCSPSEMIKKKFHRMILINRLCVLQPRGFHHRLHKLHSSSPLPLKNRYVLTYLLCHNIPPVDFLMCRVYLVVGLFYMLRIYIKITTKENTHDVAIWSDLRSPLPQMGFILDVTCPQD